MIYISAQPDEVYFIWQLKLLIFNLTNLGIPSKKIHVIIGVDSNLGISYEGEIFIEEYRSKAMIYTYKDTRTSKKYKSSIRPNLLKQHFNEHPYLMKAWMFYHDSDIIFSRKISEKDICQDPETVYVSDTKSYVGVDYLIANGGNEIFDKMTNMIGVTKDTLIDNDKNCGGAQYIFKGLGPDFWCKIEDDSEKLYTLLSEYNHEKWLHNYSKGFCNKNNSVPLQAWCSDMWALLWNLWLVGKKTKIESELNFSLPYSPLNLWKKHAILHYSGQIVDEYLFFDKKKYSYYEPWYDEKKLNYSKQSCSSVIGSFLNDIKILKDKLRPTFIDIIILLKTDMLDKSSVIKFNENKKYIIKNFNVTVYLVYKHVSKEFNVEEKYMICESDLKDTPLIKGVNYILTYPFNLILKENFLLKLLRKRKICTYKVSNILYTDKIFQTIFFNTLDTKVFFNNIEKHRKMNSLTNNIIIFKNENNNIENSYKIINANTHIFVI